MSEVVSVRLPDSVAARLRLRAKSSTESISGLAQRLVDEGLRMEAHPGIVFRGGPAGRRAALIRGPDVWEVMGLLRSLETRGDDAAREAAAWLSLTAAQVRTALGYYGEFPDEIDGQIEANRATAEAAQRSWETQQRMLS